MRNLALMWMLAGVAVALLAAGDGKPPVSTYTDKRDGKVYKIVRIGSQVWFAENLNYAAVGSECYRDSAEYCAKYGRLYKWKTAMTACPAGTHLPKDDEWTMLVDYVGGEKKAWAKLKTVWVTYYDDPVPTATNDYGFSALPGGRDFRDAEVSGFWWSATEYGTFTAWHRNMYYHTEFVDRDRDYKTSLFSVRCVVDDEKERRK
jgi:uncharacterized protein (TIGR02145 family)